MEFYERKDREVKTTLDRKKGRGLLVGFAMREYLTDVKQLEGFREDGFAFDALPTPEKYL